ncbi:MAG: MATE family efflux transporter [Puniceicoccales bacterium]|jgi:MATE family multidrug resistance protein|nr:MATE family efflux transporter [Puniceicoccales bacterium]
MSGIKLTKYASGGIRELFAISWPMMLSAAAAYLMVTIDRIILSRYSTEAFNSCFGSIQWYWAFLCTALEFALIAEVFVGQYNGAQRYKEIGPVVWQIIWFSLSLFVLFIPLIFVLIPYLLGNNIARLGVPYLKIVSLFIPIDTIGYGALAGFFIGRGKTKIVSIATIMSGVLNAVLDIILIFGCRVNAAGNLEIMSGQEIILPGCHLLNMAGYEIVPEYGVIGAAVGTVVSQTVLTLSLFLIFLKKSNRESYGTGKLAFNFPLLRECLKIGSSSALNRFVSSFFWAVITQVVAQYVTPDEFHGYGISNSIYMIFFFIIEGMSAGTRTICSNALGARSFEIVPRNMKSWISLSGICIIFVLLGMLVYPDNIIRAFLQDTGSGDTYFIARNMLLWVWLVFALDLGVTNLMSTLLASGDTKFTMYVNTLSFLCCAVVPAYIGIVYLHYDSIIIWQFLLLDSILRTIIFSYRYCSGCWMKSKLI